jgi:ribosomal protein S18 acetylase RimI-like enzyme
MNIIIQEMTIQDYDEVRNLWLNTEGVQISDTDSREGLDGYLERNPGLSFVARDSQTLVAAVLCGHDGRRGYIDQLAVSPSHRRQGIGRSLVSRCLYNLMRVGIRKWHLFVPGDNAGALAFWNQLGWEKSIALVTMSRHGGNSDSQ